MIDKERTREIVLVVDDSPETLGFLTEAMEAAGVTVLVARSGEEVAELLRGLTPDRARRIGQAALRRILSEHTYAHRAAQVETVLSVLTQPMSGASRATGVEVLP